jgi:hypothetical protein
LHNHPWQHEISDFFTKSDKIFQIGFHILYFKSCLLIQFCQLLYDKSGFQKLLSRCATIMIEALKYIDWYQFRFRFNRLINQSYSIIRRYLNLSENNMSTYLNNNLRIKITWTFHLKKLRLIFLIFSSLTNANRWEL